jgi:hypothetical protein
MFFEKPAVAFLASLPMGFAWYIKVWAPVGPPAPRSQKGRGAGFQPPHVHGMRLRAGGTLAWGGLPRTARLAAVVF